MKCPHTHYTKGKRVWIRLRDKREAIGKFVERQARGVLLDCGEFKIKEISAMGYARPATFRKPAHHP